MPADSVRDVPELALSASPDHDGYILCTKGSCASGIATAVQNNSIIGGTSASTPVFAAIATLLNQYLVTTGVQATPGLANINPRLYQLAQGTNAPTIFHDITTGNNIVPCQANTPNCSTGTNGSFGYSAGLGYDLVTGWGSVDANNLVTQWNGKTDTSTALTASATQVNVGTSVTFSAKVAAFTGSGTPSGTVTFNNGSSPTSVTPSGAAVTTTVTIQTTAPFAQLDQRHAGRGGEVFYALLIPGFMGLVVLTGNRKRTLRSVRFLGLVAVLAFSTLWMACGGGSSTPRNPGTPAGNSTVIVTATGSGTPPITHQMTITLNVQ